VGRSFDGFAQLDGVHFALASMTVMAQRVSPMLSETVAYAAMLLGAITENVFRCVSVRMVTTNDFMTDLSYREGLNFTKKIKQAQESFIKKIYLGAVRF
jgi:hypothetical protein